jgi:beta-glucosidase-like glycosyl hydrolase
VTSDSDSIADAWNQHHYVPTAAEASCAALRDGGCDIDSGNTFYGSLLGAVADGKCSMADVDRALFHTFKLRFELGLFDRKTGPYWHLGEADIGTAAAKALNAEAALKSIVLLQNPNAVLPLPLGVDVAVIGPHGNASKNMIQVDTGKICPGPLEMPADHGRHPIWQFDCVQTPFRAIAAANVGGKTTYTPGCSLYSQDESGFADALAAANAVRCAFFDSNFHLRMPLVATPAPLEAFACV